MGDIFDNTNVIFLWMNSFLCILLVCLEDVQSNQWRNNRILLFFSFYLYSLSKVYFQSINSSDTFYTQKERWIYTDWSIYDSMIVLFIQQSQKRMVLCLLFWLMIWCFLTSIFSSFFVIFFVKEKNENFIQWFNTHPFRSIWKYGGCRVETWDNNRQQQAGNRQQQKERKTTKTTTTIK